MRPAAGDALAVQRTVWLPKDQSHEVGGRSADGVFRGDAWSVSRGERGVAAACVVSGTDSPDAAFVVQLAHRARKGQRIAVLRVTSGDQDLVQEVRSEAMETFGWQRAAVRFPAGHGRPVRFVVEAAGDADVRIGSIAFWRRCGRPFYAIAHMSNSPAIVERDLAGGATAIECDVGPRDGSVDGALTAFHRFAPPYFARSVVRTPLDELLTSLRGALDRLALVVFDCHALREGGKDYRALGERLARAIQPFVPADQALFSIADGSLAGIFEGIHDAGFAAGRDLHGVQDAYRGPEDSWVREAEQYGASAVGIGTDCFTPGDFLKSWFGTVAASVNARDRGGSVAKVYYWTLSAKSAMRKMLDLAVDGLIVNDPRALREVLEEEPYRWLYRPAAPTDSQFKVHGAP